MSTKLAEIDAKFGVESKDIKRIHDLAKEATGGFQDESTKYRPPIHWQEKFKDEQLPSDENALKVF